MVRGSPTERDRQRAAGTHAASRSNGARLPVRAVHMSSGNHGQDPSGRPLRSALLRSRMGLLPRAPPMPDHHAMQVIARNAATRGDRIAVVRMGLSAILLLVAGVMVGWLCLGTPVISELQPQGRPSPLEVATGIMAWAFAIVVPAGFLLIGLARVAATLDAAASLRPRTVSPRLAKALGQDHLAATDLVIPGGRRIHELIMGPFGMVVLGDVPPASISRHVGSRWELRDGRGRWIPIEAPLDRAERDAERLRGWLTTDDRDFLVRVYAAVVTDDRSVQRTPGCAVVAPRDLPAWVTGLPVQRGLTPSRMARLTELIRSVAGVD